MRNQRSFNEKSLDKADALIEHLSKVKTPFTAHYIKPNKEQIATRRKTEPTLDESELVALRIVWFA